jgi:hypothetical protein
MHGSPVGDARRHVLFATLARGRCVHVTREGVLRAITSRERQTRHGHNGAIAKALATLATHPVIHCRRRLPTTIDDALCSCISFFFPAHTGRLSRKLVITQQLAQVLASVWSSGGHPPLPSPRSSGSDDTHNRTITQARSHNSGSSNSSSWCLFDWPRWTNMICKTCTRGLTSSRSHVRSGTSPEISQMGFVAAPVLLPCHVLDAHTHSR